MSLLPYLLTTARFDEILHILSGFAGQEKAQYRVLIEFKKLDSQAEVREFHSVPYNI